MKFSITENGVELDPSLYTWDPETKILSTSLDCLVLDFSGVSNVTFNTGNNCIFKTEDNCTFNTKCGCTFVTGDRCKFNTGNWCVFNTRDICIFKTKRNCTFDTSYDCIFDTGEDCTFNIWGREYEKMKHGKRCVVIIRTEGEMKIINLDDAQSVRFLRDDD